MNQPNDITIYRWNMPANYSQLFSHEAICEHYEIVRRRGERPVHAALWRTFPGGLAAVCVAALDYPGLLSAVTTSFLLHNLSITSAQVYSRRLPSGESEAVDLFWLRRRDAGRKDKRPPTPRQLEQSITTLVGFVRAKVVPSAVRSALPPLPISPAKAYFQVKDNGEHELVIEAFDGPGLMTHIARTLYELQLSIISSDIRTTDGMANDRFVLTRQGSEHLGEGDRERISAAVASSIDDWRSRNTLSIGA